MLLDDITVAVSTTLSVELLPSPPPPPPPPHRTKHNGSTKINIIALTPRITNLIMLFVSAESLWIRSFFMLVITSNKKTELTKASFFGSSAILSPVRPAAFCPHLTKGLALSGTN
jgi:hypothetical protein